MASFPMGSDNLNEIFSALCKAQGEIKRASKDGTNPHFRAKFSSLEAVVDASRDALLKYGLTVTQITTAGDDGSVHLITMLGHISGQYIYGRYPVVPVKQDPQGYGSALSYAKRYSLAALVGVVSSDEDDDAESAMDRRANQKPASKVQDKPATPSSVVTPQAEKPKVYSFPVGQFEGKSLNEVSREELAKYMATIQKNFPALTKKYDAALVNEMLNQIKWHLEGVNK